MTQTLTRALALALFATPLAAQFPPQSRSHPTDIDATSARSISRSAGLHLLDGELWGGGRSYKVRFDADGFEFTPALGRAAPRNYPLTFVLESIGRGPVMAPLSVGAPTFHDLRVEYHRGAVIERYDVGVEGIEQSFVFATRPPGSGDLIVRGRLSTEMVVTPHGDGLRFEQPGVGGFFMGGVVGIDGNGARAKGSVRYADGTVELSLPAAFVDHAALPLILDPPLAGAFVVSGTGGTNDQSPFVAFDATNDVFLVIWHTAFSARDIDVHAHRVNRAAQPVGTRLFIITTTTLESEGQVTNCNVRNAFVVIYTRAGNIAGRTVNAATGLLSPEATIAGSAGEQHYGTLAGDLNNGRVLCAWVNDPDLALQTSTVTVNADLTLTPGVPRSIVAAGAGRAIRPRLSQNDRGTGRHALVFQREFNSGLDSDPYIVIIDGNGAPISTERALRTAPADEEAPEVDGDGTNWVVAWWSPFAASTDIILGTPVSYDPRARQLDPHVVIALDSSLGRRSTPSVICIGDSCLVGLAQQVGTTTRMAALVRSVDPLSCATCEGRFALGLDTRVETTPFGCSVTSSGGTGEDVLLAWQQSEVTPFNGDVIVRGWRTVDGGTVSLGGGCGDGGRNRASCARSPNSAFAHRLRDAIPGSPSVFVLSAQQLGLACGPCQLVPTLNAIVLPLTTTAGGEVELRSTIPPLSPLIGVSLFTQWATIDLTSPACTPFPVDLSDALRVVIQA